MIKNFNSKNFSLCSDVLMYTENSSTKYTTETSIVTTLWAPRNVQNENFNKEIYILANYGYKHQETGEVVCWQPKY